MRYIFFSFLAFFSSVSLLFADLREDILPDAPAIQDTVGGATGIADSSFSYVRDSIFRLLPLIAVAVFLFIGARLIIARGNPEEFKKALSHFIYAAIGIVVVSLAWLAVRLISSINI